MANKRAHTYGQAIIKYRNVTAVLLCKPLLVFHCNNNALSHLITWAIINCYG